MVGQKSALVIPEAGYSVSFRQEDAQSLTKIIKKHESVCLVAMKKVGISNFVRFFSYHPQIKEKYFGKEKNNYLFIHCDLNDLLEIKPRAFWILVFKRFSEAIAASDVPEKVKKKVDKLFLQSIPATDSFFFFDSLRRSIEIVVSETGLYLVLFLSRFDRLKDLFFRQFFANLQSLFDTAKFHFIYVTTAVRALPELCPDAFDFANVALFAHSLFIKPANKTDIRKAASSYLNLTKAYSPKFNSQIRKKILDFGGGHMMLTRLIGIAFSESKDSDLSMDSLLGDERIALALEEIWANLTNEEKSFLIDVLQKKKFSLNKKVDYLFKTGILKRKRDKYLFFSPLFGAWVKNKTKTRPKEEIVDFSSKEKRLFDLLLSKKDELCRRDEIEAAVWPEYQESADLAVSEWAIDRLVYRLRNKLKVRGNKYGIITLRGRGHKLIIIR